MESNAQATREIAMTISGNSRRHRSTKGTMNALNIEAARYAVKSPCPVGEKTKLAIDKNSVRAIHSPLRSRGKTVLTVAIPKEYPAPPTPASIFRSGECARSVDARDRGARLDWDMFSRKRHSTVKEKARSQTPG